MAMWVASTVSFLVTNGKTAFLVAHLRMLWMLSDETLLLTQQSILFVLEAFNGVALLSHAEPLSILLTVKFGIGLMEPLNTVALLCFGCSQCLIGTLLLRTHWVRGPEVAAK